MIEQSPGTGTGQLTAGQIGLGNMGRPMALSILRAGLPLGVLDLDPQAVDVMIAAGARAYGSVAELARDCDVLGIVVVDDAQVDSLFYGPGGIVSSVRPGTVVMIHSTVRPATCRTAERLLAEVGALLLDAPVSGAEMAAKRGELTVTAGGTLEALEKARPVLDAVASHVFHVGGAGAGQVVKIANNLMAGINLQVVRESLRLTRAAGIDNEAFIEVATASSGDSWALRNWSAMLAAAADHPQGTGALSDLAGKDLRLALDYAGDVGASLPHVALGTQLMGGLLVQET